MRLKRNLAGLGEQMEQNVTREIPLLVIVGPTASGKTGLAVDLARLFDGEVVSADSMQVYRRMNIATAKPTPEEMGEIPHHLIDFVEPDDAAFSVADYARLAHQKITEIDGRGKLPILAGGTGLYIDTVIDNIDFENIKGDNRVRARLASEAAERGNEAMLKRLQEVDPELAIGLHPNNLGRILRALEVWETTGIPMSEHQRRSRLTSKRYKLCMLGLNYMDRALLYDRVNRRVDQMVEQGLLEEAKEILQSYGGTARQAIGYKELLPYFEGQADLESCIDRLKQMTRHYAKRQLSWFRRDERIQWLMVDQFSSRQELLETAQMIVHKSKIV